MPYENGNTGDFNSFQILPCSSIANNTNSSEFSAILSGVNNQIDPTANNSAIIAGDGNLVTGVNATAQGNSTIASGDNSHTEGALTIASNIGAHAEGISTTASEVAAHSEGISTIASGNSSHAEGLSTTASGIRSHTEGLLTTASGNQSHAEGSLTSAGGNASHAEGTGTTAEGNSSYAGGNNAVAFGATSYSWNASTTTQLSNGVAGAYHVGAPGGSIFYSNNALTTGATLAPGASAWGMVSLRSKKDVIEEEVDSIAILDIVDSMQLSRWKYKRDPSDQSENERAEHISPFADDFRVFGLGSDLDKLETIDLSGILYACVKGLRKENKSLKEEIVEIKNQLASL